jgi:yeast amino acid transporter
VTLIEQWNFFLYEAAAVPYEISAFSLVLTFWTDKVPIVTVCIGCIVLYGAINLFTVKWYGEAEFWLSTGKVLLIGLCFGFTLVTVSI